MLPIYDNVKARSLPVVTWLLILLNSLVFFYELTLPERYLEYLFAELGMTPARLAAADLGADPGAYLTLITGMFLHGGWTHFIGNMWMLYLFGDNVEDRMGPARYLAFYLLCGLAAGLTHFATNPTSPVPTIGASGAIAGVLGAYFVLFPTARVITLFLIVIFPIFLEVPAVVYLAIWFALQLVQGTAALVGPEYYEGVAWWAHVGGFLAGMLLLPVFKKSRQEYRPDYPDEYWPW